MGRSRLVGGPPLGARVHASPTLRGIFARIAKGTIGGRSYNPAELEALSATPIFDLPLSVRAIKLARALHWCTALDMANTPLRTALRVKSCGQKTLAELPFLIDAAAANVRPVALSSEIKGEATFGLGNYSPVELKALRDTPTADLPLSARAARLAQKCGWRTALEIANARVSTLGEQPDPSLFTELTFFVGAAAAKVRPALFADDLGRLGTIGGRSFAPAEFEALCGTPVSGLPLSEHARALAQRFGWLTALDIANTPINAALKVSNCGRRTITELIFVVAAAAANVKGLSTYARNQGTIGGRNFSSAEHEALRATPLAELPLSTRAKRLAHALGWLTARDVANAPLNAPPEIRNCLERTVAELRFLVEASAAGVQSAVSSQGVSSKASNAKETIGGRSFTPAELEALSATLVVDLGLSVRAKKLAQRLGWRTALDVAVASASAALKLKNCGRRTLAELRADVENVAKMNHEQDIEIPKDAPTLCCLVDDMVRSLGDKQEFVIKGRYGLWDGSKETLEDLGYTLGVTRERIRQLESKAFVRLRESHWRRVAVKLLTHLHGEIAATAADPGHYGVLRSDEMKALFDYEASTLEDEHERSRLLAFRFLAEAFGVELDLNDGRFLTSDDGILFDSKEVATRFRKVEAAAQTILVGRGQPLSLPGMTRELARYGLSIRERELERFCEVSHVVGVDWTSSVGLRRWKFFSRRNVAAVAQKALIELGQPTHYSYIADKVNALAPDRKVRSGQAVAATMQRLPAIFVSLGRGMYALRDWGISRPPFLKDFLASAIQQSGGKARVDTLATLGLQRYGFKEASISMTLSLNPRIFRDIGGGYYALV